MRAFMKYTFLLLPLLLSACIQSNPAHTRVYTPYGRVDYHCPPGHAMKGECYSPYGAPGNSQHHKHKHKHHD